MRFLLYPVIIASFSVSSVIFADPISLQELQARFDRADKLAVETVNTLLSQNRIQFKWDDLEKNLKGAFNAQYAGSDRDQARQSALEQIKKDNQRYMESEARFFLGNGLLRQVKQLGTIHSIRKVKDIPNAVKVVQYYRQRTSFNVGEITVILCDQALGGGEGVTLDHRLPSQWNEVQIDSVDTHLRKWGVSLKIRWKPTLRWDTEKSRQVFYEKVFGGKTLIFLKKGLSPIRERSALAHEIGHVLQLEEAEKSAQNSNERKRLVRIPERTLLARFEKEEAQQMQSDYRIYRKSVADFVGGRKFIALDLNAFARASKEKFLYLNDPRETFAFREEMKYLVSPFGEGISGDLSSLRSAELISPIRVPVVERFFERMLKEIRSQ